MKNEKQKETKKKKGLLGKVGVKQKLVLKQISENIGKGMTMEEALVAAGYSRSYAKSGHIKDTRKWNEIVEQEMPDSYLMQHHNELLNSRRIEHMVFPTFMSDEAIKELLESVNAVVRKIQHGEQANHVWFWTNDNRAKKDALDMMYKIKNRYDNTIKITGKLDTVSDEEIEGRIAGILSGVIGALAREGKKGKE